MPLTQAEISSVYRVLLGREPSASDLDWSMKLSSVSELRQLALTSAEFRDIIAPLLESRPEQPGETRLPLDLPPQRVDWQGDAGSQARLIDHVMRTWTLLGTDRPHWSVLSSEDFLPEKIAGHQSAFYASGSTDADLIVRALARHGLEPAMFARLVEYGCGVGRVTPHLARHFAEVLAIDISESHIAMAADAVRQAGSQNVRFELARPPVFGMTDTFDLWFSYIVLQHNPPPVIAQLLQRALSLLAPGGLAIFQVPTFASGYTFDLHRYLAAPSDTGTIEVHCLPQPVVFQIARRCGCVPLEVREDNGMGPPSHWLSNTFIFQKPA